MLKQSIFSYDTSTIDGPNLVTVEFKASDKAHTASKASGDSGYPTRSVMLGSRVIRRSTNSLGRCEKETRSLK